MNTPPAPSRPTPAARDCTEHRFDTHDGQALFYRRWPAASASARGAVLLLHRGHEHSGRMAHLVDELDLPGFDFYAWDARGHGRSPGARGFSPSFATSVRDLQSFVDHLRDAHGVTAEDVFVVAQSVGAALAATWAHDYAPRIRGMSLASPAFSIKLYVPFALPGLALLRRLRGDFYVQSYVKARMLTHEAQRAADYDADPLIARAISVNVLLGLHEAARRVVEDAQAITVPTQLLVSGADFVVRRAPQERFYANLGSAVRAKLVLPGFFHDTLGERDRAPAVAAIRQFLLDRFDAPKEAVSLRNAHRYGPTHDEAHRLASPLSPLTPRGAWWASQRASIRFGARLSTGLALGVRTGFDSGSTLDYVYRDRAEGRGAVGRAIDRQYLEAIGWRGIRVRKRHLEELLRETLARLRADGLPARILDVAAGHGRYVLDAVGGPGTPPPESILLRDYSPINVEAGRRLIAERGLAAIARFEQADAFSPQDIAAADPRPTIAVVSGLYELFPDNDLVARSLQALGRAVEPGGWIVYTGQPWHPQLEMIARTLSSHRGGAAWVMRRRSQAELDELVAAAGFVKRAQRIDEWGIFTVSVAQRVSAARLAKAA